MSESFFCLTYAGWWQIFDRITCGKIPKTLSVAGFVCAKRVHPPPQYSFSLYVPDGRSIHAYFLQFFTSKAFPLTNCFLPTTYLFKAGYTRCVQLLGLHIAPTESKCKAFCVHNSISVICSIKHVNKGVSSFTTVMAGLVQNYTLRLSSFLLTSTDQSLDSCTYLMSDHAKLYNLKQTNDRDTETLESARHVHRIVWFLDYRHTYCTCD